MEEYAKAGFRGLRLSGQYKCFEVIMKTSARLKDFLRMSQMGLKLSKVEVVWMSIKSLVGCLVLMTGLSCAVSAQVLNADFEVGTDGVDVTNSVALHPAATTPFAWSGVGTGYSAISLNGFWAASIGNARTLVQNVATVAGQAYQLDFWVRSGAGAPNWNVGSETGFLTPFVSTGAYVQHTLFFTGTGATDFISFNVVGGGAVGLLDTVSLKTVPELNASGCIAPAAFLLLGLVVLGDRRRFASIA